MHAKQTLYLAILLVALAAVVSAETSLYVPAVDTNGKGILTTITARAVPGKGDVYISVEPLISIETQQSEKTAVKIAAERAGVDRTKWDVFFKVFAPAESVDGPSGGAAMTLLAYAELSGKRMRKDFAVTGTIERDGRIGKIGGVLAKSEAVHSQGLNIFLVPLGQSLQDGVDLTQVAWDRWKMTVVEVNDIDEALKIAFAPEGSKIEVPTRVTQPLILDNLSESPNLQPMKTVAESEIAELVKVYANVSPRLSELNRKAVDDSINTSRKLLDNNYYYSAANTAFVTRMSVEAYGNLNITKTEFERRLNDAEARLNTTRFNPLTTDNFEWIVGAKLRYFWAKARIMELRDKLPLMTDPSYMLRDLASITGWISAASRLNDASPTGGQAVDGRTAKAYADDLLSNVSALIDANPTLDSEAVFHLKSARMAYNESDYVTATYDAYYAGAFYSSTAVTKDLTAQEIREKLRTVADIGNQTYANSIWGQLFFAHSLYNLAEANRTGDLEYLSNTHRLQELARGLTTNRNALLKVFSGLPFVPAQNTVKPQGQTPPATTPLPAQPSIEVSAIAEAQTSDGLARTFTLILFVVAGAGAVMIAAFLVMRMLENRPNGKLSAKEALDRLDDLFVRGKMNEQTYRRLRAKYEGAIGKGGNGNSNGNQGKPWPFAKPAPRTRPRPRVR